MPIHIINLLGQNKSVSLMAKHDDQGNLIRIFTDSGENLPFHLPTCTVNYKGERWTFNPEPPIDDGAQIKDKIDLGIDMLSIVPVKKSN